MGKIIVTAQVTADGTIDESDGWFGGGEQEEVGAEMLRLSDALLLGRKTYEALGPLWMQMTGSFADRMNNIPKYVASRSLEEPLNWNATLIKGDLADEVRGLKRQYEGNLLVYGCGEFAYHLAKDGLADEFRFWIHPLVWGSGKKPFHGLGTVRFNLKSSTVFRTGVTLQRYEPIPG